ncbi:MAG: nicotinate (nicotinamide) nucleotide adenylyltransferase [Solirubrobacteraceae bacterium]|nr:nicotinate (nicotinamide) nucleotide adenylyltransferase [Solirubrobacteraceae bacterium]
MGGTFNPPHIGHLICASEACDQLGLEKVLFVPAHTPPHKEVAAGAPGPLVRAELCRLATQDDPRFEVSELEIERGGASYTVDTLTELRAQRPGDDLVFIVGADTALSLPTWHKPVEVAQLATLGIAGRQGVLRRDIVERLVDLPVRLEFFDMPRFDISSSEIRRRLAAGQTVDYLVPAAVAAHLKRADLYRSQVHA